MARTIKTPEMAEKKAHAFSNIRPGGDTGICAFLREKRGLIQKLESEREAEYAAAKYSFSKVIMKADMHISVPNQDAINEFNARVQAQNENLVMEQNNFVSLCAPFIAPIEAAEVPVSGIFNTSEGKTISLKPYNYVASFSLKSFLNSIGEAILCGCKLLSNDGTPLDMIDVIISVIKTVSPIVGDTKLEFKDDEIKVLKILFTETGSGRYSVSEDQILQAHAGDDVVKRNAYSSIITKFDEYHVIELKQGIISFREKVYF